jgi:hypothetical protein
LNIGVAPAPSNGPEDIIADFDVTLAPDSRTIAIAGGLVGNADTPFTLFTTGGQESAAGTGVDLAVHHGSTDAPAVDVIARGVGTLVNGAAYGDITNYFNVPAGAYTLDITPAGMNETIVASFVADLTGLEGGAAVVFASGFLTPTQDDPAFGLYATLPDGTTFPLSLSTRIENELPTIGDIKIFPNPTRDIVSLQLILAEASEVTIDILSAQGNLVESQDLGFINKGERRNEILDLNDLSSGMYLIRVKSPTTSSVQKIFLQR